MSNSLACNTSLNTEYTEALEPNEEVDTERTKEKERRCSFKYETKI